MDSKLGSCAFVLVQEFALFCRRSSHRSHLNDQRSARKTMALSDLVIFTGELGKDRFKVPPLVVKLLTLLFMVVSARGQVASWPQVCRISGNSVTLTSPASLFVQTEDEILRIFMRNPNCDNIAAQNVILNEVAARNLTSGYGREVGPWYELDFVSNREEHVVKIGSRVIQRFPKRESDANEMEFFFQRTLILGRNCKEKNRTFPLDHSLFDDDLSSVDEQPPDESRKNGSIINALGVINDLIENYLRHPPSNSNSANDRLPSEDRNFANWPDWSVNSPSVDSIVLATLPPSNSDDSSSFDAGYPYEKDRQESVIPIFIGVIAFVVSMCIRFCLCRRKRVVTTVAVIRSIPSSDLESSDAPGRHQDHLDLPPAYADILNEIAEDCPPDSYMDLPPAYDDIRDYTNPPPYSEIEAQSPPAYDRATASQPGSIAIGDVESAGGRDAEEETAAVDGDTEPVIPGPDPSVTEGSSSSLARILTSQFRSLRSQFAFKPLQEE